MELKHGFRFSPVIHVVPSLIVPDGIETVEIQAITRNRNPSLIVPDGIETKLNSINRQTTYELNRTRWN